MLQKKIIFMASSQEDFYVTFPHHMWSSSTSSHIFSPLPSPQCALLSVFFLTPNSLISFHKNQLLTGGHLQHTQFFPAPKPFLWSGLTSTLSLLYPHPNLPTCFLSSLNLLEQSYSCSPVLKTTLIFKTHSIFLFKKISMINPFLILSFLMSSRTLLH